MKKYLFSIVTILLFIFSMNVVKAADKVNVYLITKNGCSWCAQELGVANEIIKEHPDLFNLIELEVFDGSWNFVSEDAQKIFTLVYDHFGEDSSRASTPTIVIGEYHNVGYLDKDALYNQIVAAKNKKDVVRELAEKNNINLDNIKSTETVTTTPTEQTNEEPATTTANTTDNNNDVFIIIAVMVILIGGLGMLVYISKK